MQARKWKTKSGKKIWIANMPDKHIINAIRYCRRFANCALRQSLSSTDTFMSFLIEDFDRLFPVNNGVQRYLALLKEAEKRKLKTKIK